MKKKIPFYTKTTNLHINITSHNFRHYKIKEIPPKKHNKYVTKSFSSFFSFPFISPTTPQSSTQKPYTRNPTKNSTQNFHLSANQYPTPSTPTPGKNCCDRVAHTHKHAGQTQTSTRRSVGRQKGKKQITKFANKFAKITARKHQCLTYCCKCVYRFCCCIV